MKIIASEALKIENAHLFQLNTASGRPGGHLDLVQLLTRRGLFNRLQLCAFTVAQTQRLTFTKAQSGSSDSSSFFKGAFYTPS